MAIDKHELQGYREFLKDLKQRIKSAQIKAVTAVNQELLLLYWQIGRAITERQSKLGWGAGVINRLSEDLKAAFPGQEGFSPRNLRNMKKFADVWPDETIWQTPSAKLPWSHNLVLIEKLPDMDQRLWYAQKAIEHGWSVVVLEHKIASSLIARQGKAPTNFDKTLVQPQSDLAHQLLKDPYSFDFLMLTDDAKERELELALVANLRDFLLELGAGFAFVGRQHHLEVAGDDFYTDLLFYHVKLHCYVVIDLKTTAFRPEYAGKMQFYVAVIDDKLRNKDKDEPTIGLILCRSKKNEIVEYALSKTTAPIGVSAYILPDSIKEILAVEEIKQHLIEIEIPGDDSGNDDENA